MAKQDPNVDTLVCSQQYSRGLAYALRTLPEHDAVNPVSVKRSLNRIRKAEAAVVQAQEYLADVVQQERAEWNLD